MRIDKINSISSVTTKQENLTNKDKQITNEKPAAVFEKSNRSSKATYEKTSHIYDKATIDRLKAESKRTYESLIRLIEDLLNRQGKSLKLLDPTEVVEVDEQARLEAQQMIAEDGPLGVEAVSQRIVDFAIAISGGDKSKLDSLKAAIDEGFKQAEKILGGLPEISRQTYDLIMEKLDNWEKSDK
ncbi:hypothetical protein DW1_0323 [Proteiniborus sp. DW1]|uniref:hypothetical protein n=1 Tax=Proteiniborus sp. DW1 TaxID=1889883 RepID=UPI00092E016C|nr:hypothetical protein [Proteiniborus sp. DW1]SCG81943.1 hypothetical protein DW1_0323 [Proteiniborus sp. DW1]